MAGSRHDYFPVSDLSRCANMRRSAAALAAAWAEGDQAPDGLLAAMRAVEQAPPETAIAALASWIDDIGWLRDRLAQAMALLAGDVFARPPLRPVGDSAFGGLLLAEAGPVRITLLVRRFEAAAASDAATALFAPGRMRLRILAAGGATIHRHYVSVSATEEAGGFAAATAPPCTNAAPRPLVTGEIFALDTAREALSLTGGTGDVLMLELAVQPPSPLPVRAYDVESGRLVHVSASQRDSSFRGMALTLLRTLGRADAVPLFTAETKAVDFAARWNAMRELVALDSAAAAVPLAGMAASDPHPEVRRAAAATLTLFERESAQCPA